MKVLLVGNYVHDAQRSMALFVAMLDEGLKARGVVVETIVPAPFFGRLAPGARGLGKWLGYADKFVVFRHRLRRAAARAEVVHVCDHSNAPFVRWVRDKPVLVTCHDLLAVRSALGEFPDNPTRWSGRILQRMILRGLRRADALACDSEATRSDVARVVGREARVIYLGINRAFDNVASGPGLERPVAGCPYLLHVGGGQWYKNRDGVLAIYAELRRMLGERAPELVLVGPPVCDRPGVRCVGPVTDEVLRTLYAGAELLLFPSLAEGFGWPIVEAQACGCRVVTTGQPPMTEAGGTAAVYLANPRDAAGCAAVVAGVLNEDGPARERRIRAGLENAARFSRAQMSAAYAALYAELREGMPQRSRLMLPRAEGGPARRHPQRRR